MKELEATVKDLSACLEHVEKGLENLIIRINKLEEEIYSIKKDIKALEQHVYVCW